MAILIQMRQRIKAIETIQKITHAMRLISMSTHTRLRGKDAPILEYKKKITHLFYQLKKVNPAWHNPYLYPSEDIPVKPLYILVGSQKGLCGNFNTALFTKFERTIAKHSFQPFYVIAIGKKAVDFIRKKGFGTVIKTYSTFNSSTLPLISKEVIEEILTMGHFFSSVTFVSNILRTFFIQKPQATQLVPFGQPETINQEIEIHDYIWEQKPNEVLDFVAHQCLQAHVQYLLFQSVLAEQAARFISMDSATRNAETLLDETTLLYNKLRQFKITKELTELTGSF